MEKGNGFCFKWRAFDEVIVVEKPVSKDMPLYRLLKTSGFTTEEVKEEIESQSEKASRI